MRLSNAGLAEAAWHLFQCPAAQFGTVGHRRSLDHAVRRVVDQGFAPRR